MRHETTSYFLAYQHSNLSIYPLSLTFSQFLSRSWGVRLFSNQYITRGCCTYPSHHGKDRGPYSH
eukprot:scaffold25663_cov105-Skeletonema_marinoi.AAC.1